MDVIKLSAPDGKRKALSDLKYNDLRDCLYVRNPV